MSFLDRIAECNAHDMRGFRPFVVAGTRVGWLRHQFAQRLSAFVDLFRVSDDRVELDPELGDFEARTAAMHDLVQGLASTGYITGWRDEYYPVATGFHAPPLMKIERSAVPWFGIRAYGVHVNGFVRTPRGIEMWIARRARGRHAYPGQLDNMVAGGQPIGLGLRENLVKEAAEEASIPAVLAEQAVPVGAVAYVCEEPAGLKPDVLFCYDLELPEAFVPRNTDGEVESFRRMPVEEVAAIVRDTREFKFNCNLVVIDFLVRHGVIGPEHEDYLRIVHGLRQGSPA